MRNSNKKTEKRERRHRKIRAKIFGTAEKPRLSVFKSNKFIYAQIIDDIAGKTLASASSKGLKGKSDLERAKTLGEKISELARTKKITKVVFDRGGYQYTGKIRLLAEAAREGGLIF